MNKMSRLKFDEMGSGEYIERKKDGVKFLVEDVMEDIKKVLVMDVTTQEEKELSASTIERFYIKSEAPEEEVIAVEEEIKPVDEPKEATGPKVRRPARKAPRPKVSKEEAVAQEENTIVEEELPTDAGKEEDAIEEAKSIQPKSLKSDAVLALSNKLQAEIATTYPDTARVVTETYIGYRRKYVFVEVFEMKRTLYINVRTDSMDKDLIASLTKRYPKSYGWVLDGKFVIKSEEDVQTAMDLIARSYHSITLK